MRAIVDSREPDNVKLKTVRGNADGDITFEIYELPQGDFYLPEHDVVVERKEASDFASSTTDGRLSEQADRMVAEHEHVFVVIERPDEPLYDLPYTKVSNNSLTGMQTSLAVKRGIKIIYTESISDTCYAVERIFERFADGEHKQADEGYVKTADTGEVDDVQVAMLMQVKGIREEKARGILNEISFDELADCAVDVGYEGPEIAKEAIKNVDGMGETLAQRVIDAFQ